MFKVDFNIIVSNMLAFALVFRHQLLQTKALTNTETGIL